MILIQKGMKEEEKSPAPSWIKPMTSRLVGWHITLMGDLSRKSEMKQTEPRGIMLGP